MYITSKELGILGETKSLTKLIEMGYTVSIPYGDNAPYDFLIHKSGSNILKVQVKTSTQTKNGKTTFELSRRRGNTSRREDVAYTSADIDYYILYSACRDKVYAVNFNECESSHSFNIRYEPPINGRYDNVNMENDYLIENVL